MKNNILLILFLGSFFIVSAQSSCPDTATYKTITIAEKDERLPFPLAFRFIKDTISVYPGHNYIDTSFDMRFLILSKQCKWNDERTIGESIYSVRLIPEGKKATLQVLFKEKKQIILIYEYDKDAMIFDL